MPVDSGVLLSGALTRSNGGVAIITNGDRNADHAGQWPGDAVTTFDQGKAGPRCVLKFGPYDYRCWYEGIGPGVDGSGQSPTQFCYATSSNGIDWIKYAGNPVLAPSPTGTAPTWEQNEFTPTTVLWDPDAGIFKAWAHGGNNLGPRKIGYATSPDGITWTKYASNPVINVGAGGTWNEKALTDITVLRLSATDYRAWVGGWTAASAISYGYYTSTDGIAWTPYVSNPVCPTSFVAGQVLQGQHVIMVNGVFHMWCGTNSNGIYYSSSTDGFTWATPISVLTGAEAPGDTITAYVDGTTVRVLYGVDNSGVSPTSRSILEATVATPLTAAQNPVTGVGIWPNGSLGVSGWASLANNQNGISGQITTDRYNGHAAAITVTLKTGTVAPAANRHWEVWLQSSTDGGTVGAPTFSPSHTGGLFLGMLRAPTAVSSTATAQFDTAGFLSILPETWCIQVVNRTGQTMAASGHSCFVKMRRAG